MKYIAFDLEITREIPEGADDWSTFRPLGISCAATLTDEGNGERQMRVWHGSLQEEDGLYAPQMSPYDCRAMLAWLVSMQYRDYRIVTVNGLGFDFDILAEECKRDSAAEACRGVALYHTDIGFAMFCQRGFMVGLSAMAQGLGVAGKMEGMSGALAPAMWAESRESQDKVLEYVQQDAQATADVYDALLAKRHMYWTTKRGTRSKYPWTPRYSDGHILSVRESLELPEPDVSWMSDPWPRSKFCGWATTYGEKE